MRVTTMSLKHQNQLQLQLVPEEHELSSQTWYDVTDTTLFQMLFLNLNKNGKQTWRCKRSWEADSRIVC